MDPYPGKDTFYDVQSTASKGSLHYYYGKDKAQGHGVGNRKLAVRFLSSVSSFRGWGRWGIGRLAPESGRGDPWPHDCLASEAVGLALLVLLSLWPFKFFALLQSKNLE